MTFGQLFIMFSDMGYYDRFYFCERKNLFRITEFEDYDSIPQRFLDMEVNSFSSYMCGRHSGWLVTV